MCFKRLRNLKNLCKYEPEDFNFQDELEKNYPYTASMRAINRIGTQFDFEQGSLQRLRNERENQKAKEVKDFWKEEETFPSINYFRDRDNPVVDERGRLDGLDPKEWYAKKLAAEKETEELLEDWNEYFEEHNKEYPAPDLISLTTYLEIDADFKFREYLKDYNITVEQINDILVLHWDDSFKFSNEGEPEETRPYNILHPEIAIPPRAESYDVKIEIEPGSKITKKILKQIFKKKEGIS